MSFEDAAAVFDDPFASYEQADAVEGEARWRVTGLCRPSILLTVVYPTWEEEDGTEVYCIISAREATRRDKAPMNKASEGEVRIRGPIDTTTEAERGGSPPVKNRERPIDFSDIPEADDRLWKYGFRSPRHAVNRPQLQVRLEPDVSAWIDSSDRNVHDHVSAVLREAMQRARAETAAAFPPEAAHPEAARPEAAE